jgi:hypothetical protein
MVSEAQRKEDTAQLLSPATNSAVVHLPGRRFPGVVVQGDTLNGLVRNLKDMSRLLNKEIWRSWLLD